RRLTFPVERLLGDSGPAFSSDGHTLAFSRTVDGGVNDLYLLAISEGIKPLGEPKRLTFRNPPAFNPVWTPGGQEIIFGTAGYPSGGSLWRIATSGPSPPQRLASVGEEGRLLDLSRNGNRLVCTRNIDDTNIWRLELPGPKAKTSLPVTFISST